MAAVIASAAQAGRKSAYELAEIHKAQSMIEIAQSMRSLVDEVRKIAATVARMETKRMR